MSRVDTIRVGAERLRRLNEAINTTVADRDNSPAEWAAWKEACAVFHAEYSTLFYPGGAAQLKALSSCDMEALEIALDYLEADPYCFGSGYRKEMLWKHLPRCPLKNRQISRLENIALSYTRRRMRREFWYMARAMARIGREAFWQEVREYAAQTSGRPEGVRAACLAAYAEGIDAGEKMHRRVQMELADARFDLVMRHGVDTGYRMPLPAVGTTGQ